MEQINQKNISIPYVKVCMDKPYTQNVNSIDYDADNVQFSH
jgi:hypothetical protein